MKTEQIISEIKQHQADAAWITTPLNIFYFTGYLSDPHERLLALLIKADGTQVVFCPQLEVEEVKASPFTGEIIGYLDTENALDKYQFSATHLLVEAEHLTLKRQRELTAAFGAQKFNDIDATIKALRNIKSTDEIATIQKACELADKCIEIGVSYLSEGVTERQVVNHIENEIKAYGVNEMSFDTMVLFGDHAASPHGTPGDRKLQNNEFVLFDLGVIYNNYCSDMTRTVKFGTPNAKAQEIYDVVLKAETEAIAAIKPGVTISEVDHIARNIIAEAGYGEYFPHRLGHGLGLEEHEYQDISSTNHNQFEAGMVITIEPGIYVPEVAGVRIEDDVVVTEDGHKIMTGFDK